MRSNADQGTAPCSKTDILSVFFIYIYLIFLAIKSLQEIAGFRIVSILVPICLVILNINNFNAYKKIIAKTPWPLLVYIFAFAILIPLLNVVFLENFTVYPIYLSYTILSSFLVLLIALNIFTKNYYFISRHFDATVICLAIINFATFEMQWFGSYTIRSFSDFSTLFALQLSLCIPFISGRLKILKQFFLLFTIVLSFSRISLFFGTIIIIIQAFRDSVTRGFLLLITVLIVIATVLTSTNTGQVMSSKLERLFDNFIATDADRTSLDPSDLGRVAYIEATFNGLDGIDKVLFGSGVKTNESIIAKNLNVNEWGLDESMASATVHNVYIEMLSDIGLTGLLPFLALLVYIFIRLIRMRGFFSPVSLAYYNFILTYMFEANYVTFFFQFMIFFFLFCTLDLSKPRSNSFKYPSISL